MTFKMRFFFASKNNEHDQAIPQSQTTDKPVTLRERATQQKVCLLPRKFALL